jgi:hypothetical protein
VRFENKNPLNELTTIPDSIYDTSKNLTKTSHFIHFNKVTEINET